MKHAKNDPFPQSRPLRQAMLLLMSALLAVSCSAPLEQPVLLLPLQEAKLVEEPALIDTASAFVTLATYDTSKFTKGYCTYGVVLLKGTIEWKGNAKDWYTNAKAAGIQVGSTAKKGAIVVFPGNSVSSLGHVGVITGQNANGKWLMKSMNDVDGWNKWTTRPALEYVNSKNRVTPTGYIYYKLDKY